MLCPVCIEVLTPICYQKVTKTQPVFLLHPSLLAYDSLLPHCLLTHELKSSQHLFGIHPRPKVRDQTWYLGSL